MIRYRVALLALTLCAVVPAGRADAQFSPFGSTYNPQYGGYNPQQPQFSPALNILRGNPAVNYYGAVRGAIPSYQQNYLNNQFGASIMDIERASRNQGALTYEDLPLLSGTGHPTAFGFYAPYYNLSPLQRIPPRLTPQQSGGVRKAPAPKQ